MTTPRLEIVGPNGTDTALLDPRGVTLGRGTNCEVLLDSDTVSRQHARIYQDNYGRWIIEDLGSQNGVIIDEERIKSQVIIPDKQISIQPFTLRLLEESSTRSRPITSTHTTTMSVIDKGLEEKVIAYKPDRSVTLSPTLIHDLNEFRSSLLKLTNPSELYRQACRRLGMMLDMLVVVLRLPSGKEPLSQTPEMVACSFGTDDYQEAIARASGLHFSKRVLEAVRTTDSPVMASSGPSSDKKLQLTIVDKHEPHLVFAAPVNNMEQSIDALYIDILERKSPEQMFDFVEAVASDINFVQKSLYLTELTKQEKALREANAQLKEKDRIKDEYVSRVTHDIKGHLATIQSCLFVVSSGASDVLEEKQADFLNRAQKRTEQLTSFVRELLDLTLMRLSGRIDMEAFSLKDSITKSLAAIARKAEDKSITVTSNVDESIGQIEGNEFSINEMLTNLLFNAVKYTPQNKTIHLEAKCCDGQIQIDISDTGIGVPSDDLPHLFDEFFRASNAKKTEKDGTGLGLSIVKQIIDRHGGQISASSIEGEGTTFTIILPNNSPIPA